MKRNLFGSAFLATILTLFAMMTNVQGQMGGMGGGFGPQKTPMELLMEEIAKKPVVWSRPTGEEPAWLSNGKSSVDATESLRAKLNETVEIETSGDFKVTQNLLKEKLGLEVDVNLQALEEEGFEVTSITGLPAGTGPVREQLRRMLDPLDLTYRVCEGYIEITTKAEAIDNPSMRFYDLSYVVRDNSRLAEILNAIYTSVDPNSWDLNGGNCTCVPVGQMLVVRTSEINHLEIERLLARLSVNQPPAASADSTAGSP